jgi:Domain of unknown function (DUF4190)
MIRSPAIRLVTTIARRRGRGEGGHVSNPQQPGGQQLPVCANGHPVTTVDASCPLCGARRATGTEPGAAWPGAGGGYPDANGFPPPAGSHGGDGYAPPAGLQGGDGYAPPCGSGQAQGAAGYQTQAAGYPAGGYWQPAYQPARTNVLAIVSLVAGILWFFWLGSVVALVCGVLALGQIRTRGEAGRGIAIGGIVLACIGLVTLAGTVAAGVILAHSGSVQPNSR